ncbi:MAG: response regulator [Anaerolineales bacterium]
MAKTILVIEDEAKIVRLVRMYLEEAGYTVVTATDGEQGLFAFRREKPSLVVLDLALPKLDGLEVCRTIRRDSNVPIIMLTARSEEIDKLLGLELGADDYITKPFSPRELVARVRTVLRRAGPTENQTEVIEVGDVHVDLSRRRVRAGDQAVELTQTEFGLLAALARRPGQVLTRLQLLDQTQGNAFEGYERTIDQHIKNLRRKLEPDPHTPRYILTVRGIGYRFADE